MAQEIDTAPAPGPAQRATHKLTTVGIVVDKTSKDVLDGPATIKGIGINNTVTGGAKEYVKLYDLITDALVAGTSAPALIIPVPAAGTNPAAGVVELEIDEGVVFRNGVSVLASDEDGDEIASAPDQSTDVYLSV